ncbi:hypothetical protein Tco_1285417 [Tanacetum coccineum]
MLTTSSTSIASSSTLLFTTLVIFSIAYSSPTSSSTNGDNLVGGGLSSNVTLSDSSTFIVLSLLNGSTDPEMVDLCASMVDPLHAVLADSPTKLMGLVPLVDALLLSNPKPILQLGDF